MLDTEPDRTQCNETAVRWFLVALLEPADRRAVLERELASLDEKADALRAVAAHLDALPAPHPFRPTVDLGLRQMDVMRDWLREQLRAASA